MLLPKFTIRWILGATFALAVLFVVIRNALAGSNGAIAVVAFFALALGCFCLYAVGWLVAFFAARILRRILPEPENHNPFLVEGQFPPQSIPKHPVQDQV